MASRGQDDREAQNTGTREVAAAHRFDEVALAAWMSDNIEGFNGPLTVRQFRGGQSNPTYDLGTPGKSYVLRRKPPGKLLPSAHAVEREFRVISALHPTGFPVPRPYGLCEDQSVIGTAFYAMEKVEGRVLWNPLLPACAPSERRAIYLALVQTLARLHSIDPATVGLADYGRPGNYFTRQVDRWTRQYRASEMTPLPDMDRLIAFLPASVPNDDTVAVVHGDFRLDNLIFEAGSPRVSAVLDWELSTLGAPLADFTYFLMSWLTGPLAETADKGGIPEADEIVAEYCRLTGRAGIPALDWYASYNLFRMAAIVQGILGRVRDGTASHPQAAELAEKVPRWAAQGWAFALQAGA